MVISVLCEYSKALRKVKSAVRKWFQKNTPIFFKDGFQKLVHRWREFIEVRGDFVEEKLSSFENNWRRHIYFFYFI